MHKPIRDPEPTKWWSRSAIGLALGDPLLQCDACGYDGDGCSCWCEASTVEDEGSRNSIKGWTRFSRTRRGSGSSGHGRNNREGERRLTRASESASASAAEVAMMWRQRDEVDNPKRYSSILEAALLLAELVRHGMRTIAFCTTRKLSELVLQYAQEALSSSGHGELCSALVSYRGGYTPAQRRAVEARLFGDELRGVTATNALELGVDVGSVDATLHLGFQRSVASLWQQAGRAGRRGKTSLSIYVAWDSPLDQHFLRNPRELLLGPEAAEMANPLGLSSECVLHPHLLCAAAEAPPLTAADFELFGASVAAVKSLIVEGFYGLGSLQPVGASMHRPEIQNPPLSKPVSQDHYSGVRPRHLTTSVELNSTGAGPAEAMVPMDVVPAECTYSGIPKPWRNVSLRSMDDLKWTIQVPTPDRPDEWQTLEEVEERMAFFQIYEGAVYMNSGRTYLIHSVNYDIRVAKARGPIKVDYFTSVRDLTNIDTGASILAYVPESSSIHEDTISASSQSQTIISLKASIAAAVQFGPATIRTSFLGFNKFRRISGELLDTVDLQMPQVEYETFATWVRVPDEIQLAVQKEFSESPMGWEEHLRGGLHAACHALANALPLFARCTPADVLAQCAHPAARRYKPRRLLLADRCRGGCGIAKEASERMSELVEAAFRLVEGCTCRSLGGCPGCVHMLSCTEHNYVLDKRAAKILLDQLLHPQVKREKSEDEGQAFSQDQSAASTLNRMVLERQRTAY